MKRIHLSTTAFLFALCALSVGENPGTESPKIIREEIEWLDVWVPGNSVKDQPKVLLIGDSITGGYHGVVTEQLKGKAVVAKLATSKSVGDPALLAQISLVLGECHFDVVHFNNGMHGWDYTEEDYRKAFPELIATIKKGAPGAKLIWATTTPVREREKLEVIALRTERVKERNKIAAELVAKENIPVDDLYTLVADHTEYFSDGVHFNKTGTAAQGAQVAQKILDVLK